jgi:hypothetical protein
MRPLLLIPLLLAGCLKAQPGGAAGVVVDQTGKPLAGVHVRLMTGEFGSENGIEAVYGATSDASGQFSVDGLKAGMYRVLAERAGYVQTAAKPSPMGMAILAVKPGQHLTDYKVVLSARGLIVGHVLDEFGDPVQNLSVQIESVSRDQPEGFMFGGRNVMPDDRGEFRLIVPPGKYYVKAEVFQEEEGPPEIRTDGTSSAPFKTTYYPSAANTGAASVVQVAAGQDLAGIDIHVMRAGGGAATHSFTVSGVVVGTPDNERANVMLGFGDGADEMYEERGTMAEADGKFSFTGLRAGFYSVAASYTGGKTPLQSRAVRFQLDAADETGVQLTLSVGEELTGTLELVGDAPAGAPEKRIVRLEAAGWGERGDPPAAEVGQDGSFHLNGIMPSKFKPVVEPMPENGYVKEVALDGKAVSDRVLDFSQGVGGARLKIVVSRAGGQISGRILDKDGEPALGPMVVFFGTDPKHMDDNSAARVIDGKYSFKAIRPGKYRLLAIDIAQMMQVVSGDGNNDETMQQLFDAGEEIEIKEGDRVSKDIPVLTKMPEKKEAR